MEICCQALAFKNAEHLSKGGRRGSSMLYRSKYTPSVSALTPLETHIVLNACAEHEGFLNFKTVQK